MELYSCALYLRLSREDEKGGESASIETQRKILRDFAGKKSFAIYDEYVDDGYTGTNMERPAFQRMLRDVENGKIQIIITKDLSRLGRNSGRVSMLIDEYFPQHNIRYISVSEGIDTETYKTSRGVETSVYNWMNEYYAGDISRKIHAAFDIKMQEGECISAFAPFGYQKDPCNKNHLIPDSAAAEVVVRMFQLAKSGYRPSQIAAIFNAERILTPSQYRYQKNPHLDRECFRGTTEWKAANISKMLRNEVYLGHMLQGKTFKPTFKSKVTKGIPQSKWIVVRNTHEALVDVETWEIVRKQMESRIQKREKGFVNLFSGLAVCADCGKNMSSAGTRKKGSAANLNCGGYKLGGRKYCTNHTIGYEVLYQVVLQVLREQIFLTGDEKQQILQEMLVDTKQKDKSRGKELRKRITEINQKLQALFDDKYSGFIQKEQFEALHQRYTEELTELRRKQEELQEQRSIEKDFIKEMGRYERFRQLVDAYDDLQVLDRELLFELIDRIEIHQGEYIEGVKYQTIDIWFRFQCEQKTVEISLAPQ